MTVLSQNTIRDGCTSHAVTALDNGVICVGHTHSRDGYVDMHVQLTVEQATALRDLLTEALALYPVKVEEAA